MKILFIINQLSPAGAEKLVALLSKSISAERIVIYAIRKNKNIEQKNAFRNLVLSGVTIVESSYESCRGFKALNNNFINLKKIVEVNEIDIIHSHCELPDIFALLLKNRVKKIVRTAHNEKFSLDHKFGVRLPIQSFLSQFFDQNICISKKIYEQHPPKKRTFITNAIDLSFINNVRTISQNNRMNISIVGRFTTQKNQVDWANQLVESGYLASFKDIKFNFYGDGESRVNLEEIAGKHPQIFEVKGFCSNIEEIYQNSDVVLITSLWEGISTVMLESLCRGIPTLTSNVSGAEDVNSILSNNIIIDVNNFKELALKIKTAPSISKKEQESLITTFSLNKFIKLHKTLYRCLLNE
ncbi:glycosyltransferase [Psychrosphaera haliotis]|uniref:Glycosyltransferase n=1 Tax=Psychrosphaera haliotis TaxID=555083 RepID=A0A6N8F587_9GAMM|nr:glycosyltransferase [Psychrosphaera haliotis]MUH71348.1 glycosyltransferase [Psychrosphaera haliotis]